MKNLKLFENWSYDKIMDKFKSDKDLDDIVAKYIYWKRGNEQKDIEVSRIYYDNDILWVNYNFTEDGGGRYSTTFKIKDSEEFDTFAKDPDVYIEQEKYNL